MMTYVCFHDNSSFGFGKVIHRRDDDMWVEVVSPNTRYSPERRYGMIIPASRVIAEGDRYKMEMAALKGNMLREPRASMDAATHAVKLSGEG